MLPPRSPLLALAVALAAAACSSLPDVKYAPPMQHVELRETDESVSARLVAAWRGLAELDDGVIELRFRLRVENPGMTAFTLLPAELELLDAALRPFGPARAEELPGAVEPGAIATFDVAFPLPEGASLEGFDLDALDLRVRLQAGRWTWNATFLRALPVYHDPYWHAPVQLSFGATWWVD